MTDVCFNIKKEFSNKSCFKEEWTQVVKFPVAANAQTQIKMTFYPRCYERDS